MNDVAKAQAGEPTSKQERQMADLQKQNTQGLGPTEETRKLAEAQKNRHSDLTLKQDLLIDGKARFVEQLGESNAKKLVAGSGNKFRPVSPVKMLEMETAFTIHVEKNLGGHLLKGERGDYLGLAPDGSMFVVPRDEREKIWKEAKR